MEVVTAERRISGTECFPNLAIAATVFALGAIRTMCISKAAFTAAIAAIGTIRTYDATVAAILRISGGICASHPFVSSSAHFLPKAANAFAVLAV